MFVYREFGAVSEGINIFLLFVVGFLANGPYALITTAVSADLGTHPKLKGSTRALATVKNKTIAQLLLSDLNDANNILLLSGFSNY